MAVVPYLRRVCAALAVAAVAIGGGSGAALAQMNYVDLTPASVEAVIASYPDVKRTTEELQAQHGNPGGGNGDLASGLGAWLAVSGAHAALNGAVQPHGFTDYQAWLATLSSVVFAYTFAGEGANADSQMANAAVQIQNNPNLSDAQKEMMLQQIQASIATLRPPQANLDAVAPYAAELRAMFDSN